MANFYKNIIPIELFDKILIQLGDIDIAIKLKRYYAFTKIYKEDDNIVDWAMQSN